MLYSNVKIISIYIYVRENIISIIEYIEIIFFMYFFYMNIFACRSSYTRIVRIFFKCIRKKQLVRRRSGVAHKYSKRLWTFGISDDDILDMALIDNHSYCWLRKRRSRERERERIDGIISSSGSLYIHIYVYVLTDMTEFSCLDKISCVSSRYR